MMKIISTKNNNYHIIKGNSKLHNTSVYKRYLKTDKYDVIKWQLIADTLSAHPANYNKLMFEQEIAKLYSPTFNINIVDYQDTILVYYNIQYISSKVIPDIKEDNIISLFNSYINNMELDETEYNLVLSNTLLNLNKLKGQSASYAKRILEDSTFKQQHLTYDEEIKFVSTVKFNELVSFFAGQTEIDGLQINISKDGDQKELITDQENSHKSMRYIASSFDDVMINNDLDQANVLQLFSAKGNVEVLQLFNLILGGDAKSKLFTNVREKHSLCYSIGSQVYESKNILIQIGTDPKNIDQAIELINKEIEQLKVDPYNTLSEYKLRLISRILSKENDYRLYQNILVNNYLFKQNKTLEKKIEGINNVTTNDIIECANSLSYLGKVIVK